MSRAWHAKMAASTGTSGAIGGSADGSRPCWHNEKRGLLPIEWVIFRNLDVIPVFDDNTLANRWSLLSVAPRRGRVRAPIGLIREPRLTN